MNDIIGHDMEPGAQSLVSLAGWLKLVEFSLFLPGTILTHMQQFL